MLQMIAGGVSAGEVSAVDGLRQKIEERRKMIRRIE